jgi:hypothetical protein
MRTTSKTLTLDLPEVIRGKYRYIHRWVRTDTLSKNPKKNGMFTLVKKGQKKYKYFPVLRSGRFKGYIGVANLVLCTYKENVKVRANAWAKMNPWFGKDKPATHVAFEVHKHIVEELNVRVDSDKYWKLIDEALGDFKKAKRGTCLLTPGQKEIASRLSVPLYKYWIQLYIKKKGRRL